MFSNYLKSALRSLKKQKVFSLINILGLAFGMTAFLVIMQYASYELSYDSHHVNKDRVYRLKLNRYNKGELSTEWASGCAGVGDAIRENFEEVEERVKLYNVDLVMSFDDNRFKENDVYFATPSVFDVFSIPIVQGNRENILTDLMTVVISESISQKYFGDEDPIGKRLRINDSRDAEVTAVFQDIPENSHMQVEMFIPWKRVEDIYGEGVNTAWQWDGFMTYVMLQEGTDIEIFESKLPQFVQDQAGEELEEYDAGMEFILQPIDEIYLTSNYIGEFKTNGDGEQVNFLIIIAIFIILIAWVNYINLSTSKSIERAREVGIRKVMGSFRFQLVGQFLMESLITNLTAIALASFAVLLIWPSFQGFIEKEIALTIFTEPVFWGAMGGLVIVGTLLSGLYPAFILSSFRPSEVLKGKFSTNKRGVLLRKTLVVLQFTISMLLIVGTLTVFYQLHYMQNQNLGVDINQTLVITAPHITDSTYTDKREVFRNEILRNPEILSMSISTEVPGRKPGWNAGGVRKLGQDASEGNQYRILAVDGNFVDAYDMEMVLGRDFDDERTNETEHVLFNESAIKQMGFDSPEEALEEYIYFWGDTFQIVGILKDYHQQSLKEDFEPLIFRYQPNWGSYFSLKISGANYSEVISKVEDEFQATFAGNPFDYFFLDEHFDKQYKSDKQFGEVFTVFAVLAILIACLGLYGLSSYTAAQRTKEIGVRKVLGATAPIIFRLLTKDFMRLILIAIILAVPLSYYIMDIWLQNFANAISMDWWLFMMPAVILTMVAVLTLSYHTVKTSSMNPAKSLHYE